MKRYWIHNVKEGFLDGIEQYIQLIILICVIGSPYFIDFSAAIEKASISYNVEELVVYFTIMKGKIFVSIFLFCIMCLMFHRINSTSEFNMGSHYHCHIILWYWFCSKILGYKKCNLIRVPIATQYKLIVHDIFNSYDYGSDDYYEVEKDDKIVYKKLNFSKGKNSRYFEEIQNISTYKTECDVLNVVISDTYPIAANMLPEICGEDNTIMIQRISNSRTNVRYYSRNLIDSVTDIVQRANNVKKVNVFSTTNAKNTYEIVNKAFKKAGRSNIEHLYVHKQLQKEKNNWQFENKGLRIY